MTEGARLIQKRKLGKAWYIWHTRPRAEKAVHERLLKKGIEVYLPLQKELRQWSDRKKWVEMPLFPGYIFTCIDVAGFGNVQFTEGILSHVRFESGPAILRQEQIQEIKRTLSGNRIIEIADNFFAKGEEVHIVAGPLRGLKGEVVEYRGGKRLAVRLDQLGKALLVELPLGAASKAIAA
jgi:transcription antitermination factor NusG